MNLSPFGAVQQVTAGVLNVGYVEVGPANGRRDHEHYGPWPDLPNWIQANWDLTAEVIASDFHRILKQRAQTTRV